MINRFLRKSLGRKGWGLRKAGANSQYDEVINKGGGGHKMQSYLKKNGDKINWKKRN